MHDLATIRRHNDEAADRELKQQERQVARLEARLRQRGVEVHLGETIQSAADAIACRLRSHARANGRPVRLGS
jgi:L-lactate utilization protein LutB